MIILLLLAAIIVGVDQYTKLVAFKNLATASVEVTSFFNLALAFNTGAAFSFLGDAGGWQTIFFVAAAAVVSAVILFWIITGRYESWLSGLGLSLLLGGAIGNLIDRVVRGYVVDFLDFHYAGWHWPTFNVADIAIFIGVAFIILDLLELGPKSRQKTSL